MASPSKSSELNSPHQRAFLYPAIIKLGHPWSVVMPIIDAADLGLPPDSPINLTNNELAQRLTDLLPALPPLYVVLYPAKN